MKNYYTSLLLVLLLMISTPGWTQLDLLKKAKQKTEKRTSEEADKKIDDGLDKLFGKKKKTTPDGSSGGDATIQPATKSTEPSGTGSTASGSAASGSAASPSGVLNWAKYDFVPGDEIIFEDNLMFEENGEFPSRWDLQQGTAEIAKVDGENVIFLRGGAPRIVPYLDNSSEDYLPDIFTIEFDVYFGYSYMEIDLYDRKNQRPASGSGQYNLDISYNGMDIGNFSSTYPDKNVKKNRWAHVAIAYTNGKLKAYLDDTRLINIPRLEVNPTGFSVYSYHASNDSPLYVKNVRIAKGGVKYYDRVMQDGKIVANGIRFGVGEATIKPESMGIINEVVGLMQEHPDLKFSIEGHTDSDGNDELNLELSQKRAESVMSKMIGMGISKDRLQAKGRGESQPITGNASPEDKANNRRVEFVKL